MSIQVLVVERKRDVAASSDDELAVEAWARGPYKLPGAFATNPFSTDPQ